jgi:EpsD family peptidyl-prolyl cis-trans isomerase
MRLGLLILPACLAITACGGDAEPTGQVVAVVDGQEITINELNAELNGARGSNPQQQRQLQQAALQSIINRMLLANAAEEQGLTDGPQASLVQRRAEQMARIELFERNLRSSVPNVSNEEVESFITDNPNMFAQRRIWLVEQIIVPNPPQALLRALRPLDTMTQVQAELGRFNLPTRTSFGVIDALTLAPEASRQISALAPDAVFILPDNGSIRINRIRESQVQAITGNDATQVAREMLRNRRAEQQVAEAAQRILREGMTNVRYNPEYRPPAQPQQQQRPTGNGEAPAPANKG